MDFKSKSNWGDRTGSQLKGPEWTPYAQAIADHYPTQIPWFYTLPSNLVEGFTFQDRKTVTTTPQQHDILIFGAYAIVRGTGNGGGGGDDGAWILLQITHEETGIPWVVPNVVGAAPLTAIAGSVRADLTTNRTTILKLPEAFFLPKHNRLKLDWAQSSLAIGSNLDALITFVGVQLIGAEAPTEITMPDGQLLPIGARLPWFNTVVLGYKVVFEQWIDWLMEINVDSMQFGALQNYEVEIHDCNLTRIGGTQQYSGTLMEFGDIGIWTPHRSPIRSFTGHSRQINPAMPFTKPFLLKTGHRLALIERTTGGNLFENIWNMLTFRGVRLCKF